MVDMLVRGQLKPVITNITNHLNQLLYNIFKVTEDDASRCKLLGIFYEVLDIIPNMMDMLVRDQLQPVITNITNLPNQLLPTILKAIEDDSPSCKLPGIFYEVLDIATEDDSPSYKLPVIFYEVLDMVLDMVDMLVRGQPHLVITNITNHLNQLLSTIFNVTEDDAPSYELLVIFYELPNMIDMLATEDNSPSYKLPGIFYEVLDMATEDDSPSYKLLGIFYEVSDMVTEDDAPSYELPVIFYQVLDMVDMLVRGQPHLVITNITNHLHNMLPTILKVTEDDALSYKLPAIFYEVPNMVDMLVTEDDASRCKILGIFYEVSDLVIEFNGPRFGALAIFSKVVAHLLLLP
ncbi:uncharacterized protein F5891DRAFT_979629 [Suillus fuscotomentosus]|uniref:Uncharacterized protein n=1 Tax=Suillus fuscotomentosus TaxID=1912939 RepID=A0AAD4E7H1_9AGAM|nr:uncharacterized protein F5891DRAFT_979629 [Suillus fuscotomentosus]KAG1901056.1 hypothetical protein F5891DRAFT_979629 [Suillus fuscotomentosus]